MTPVVMQSVQDRFSSAGCRCFSPLLCVTDLGRSYQEEVVTREITGSDTDWKYLTLHKLTQELLDCCPSHPGRLTAEYTRAGTCVFVCVCFSHDFTL